MNAHRPTKAEIRRRVWARLIAELAAPADSAGRIPDFTGADAAADRLADLDVWSAAKVVVCVPDSAQAPVRRRALDDGKLLYMAVPGLAAAEPFVSVDPRMAGVSTAAAAEKDGALAVGRPADPRSMPPVDLFVCGSVAVNLRGQRLGKGAGYTDIELALLDDAHMIGALTRVVTTVHDLQIVGDDDIEEERHDWQVDLIVTPTRSVGCVEPRRPQPPDWSALGGRLLDIPAVASRAATSQGNR